MNIDYRRKSTWPGLVLVVGLTGTLAFSQAEAHEVHGPEHLAEHARALHDHQPLGPAVDDRKIEDLLRLFRQTGNDLHLDEAWAIAEQALADHAKDPHILVEAAMVAQSRHRFAQAMELVNRALTLNPDNDQAWLLLASIHLVRGNAAAAESACRQLRHVPLLVALTCHARAAFSRGDPGKAGDRLDALLAVIDPASANPDWFAWSLSVAGDIAAERDVDQAISYYEQSLRYVESSQVRSALVDVLLTNGDLERAVDAVDSGPPALPLTVRRMILHKQLGHLGSIAREIDAADREFQRWIADEDWLHAREMARFYLDVADRPALARRLALINLSHQREPEDLRLERRTRS